MSRRRSGRSRRISRICVRGDVYRLRHRRDAVGPEQHGMRYGVVVQSDALLLSTVLIAPTSRSAGESRIRPVIDIDGTATRVLVDQTSAVAAERLGSFAGRLDARELAELDDALRIVFGLF
jgi:mRNA interferase MazF